MMQHNINIDFQNKAEIEKFQTNKLIELLNYLEKESKFYQNFFRQNNIDIHKIRTITDLKQIPPTTKRDIQLQNWDFLCVDRTQIVEYVSTSGTLGKPVVVALTKSDLQRLAYNEYLSYTKMGINHNDVIQLALTLDKQFMAGMAYYQGAHMLGAAVIRTGPGVPSMQWDTIFRMQTTTLVAVPSFIIKLIEYAEQNHIDYRRSSLKRVLCIGENVRKDNLELNIIGKSIKDKWAIDIFSTYASSEMQTAFTECSEGRGGHIHPELVLAEVLDDYGNAVPNGEVGELVITTLGVEGMPLLRYQTGDLCYVMPDPCFCGRNTIRISPIFGRKSQMVKLKGTSLYPPMIFEILNAKAEIADYVVEVSSNQFETDDLTIYIALKNPEEEASQSIKSYLHASLRVRPEIIITDIKSIQNLQMREGSRKIIKFIDKRDSLK